MTGGRIFTVAVCALVLLVGVGLVIGGGSILWANIFMKDAEGFYTTGTVDVNRDSFGITSHPAEIDIGHIWVLDWLKSIEIKLIATNKKDKDVFVGIAQEKDLRDYFNGVAHDQIEDLDLNYPIGKPKIEYEHIPGTASPAPPANQGFWTASASGTGTQVLHWSIEEGTYSVALMNQDGSRGVNINAAIGAKVPIPGGIGLWLAIAGIVLVLLSFFFLYITVTRSDL